MASIREVAKKAGVGIGTVSRALNKTGYVSPDTRKKIAKAVDELGYTPNELARNLFRNRTGIIGVIVPDLSHPFFSSLAKHIEMALYSQGYKTMICNAVGVSDREKEYLEMLSRNMVDGIITASHILDDEEYLRHTKPIVSIDRNFGSQIPLIGSDHAKMGALAAELLLESGCTKVLQVSGVSPKVVAAERHASFTKIMQEHHVEVIEIVMDWNTFVWDAHYKKMEACMKANPGIDGVFGSDIASVACMNVALQQGMKIPEDLSLIAIDGTDITRMVYPRLSAIRQNVQLLAEVSVNTLLDLACDRKRVPHRQILDVEIQRGETLRG